MSDKTGGAGDGKKRWRGFVDVRLPAGTEWEQIAEEMPASGLFTAICDLVGAGLKVSLSFSEANDAYVCSLTGTPKSKANSGYTMTTWSARAERAVAAAWYKHYRVCDGGAWGELRQSGFTEI